ncbi:MAG: alpha/beta hydrolase, partial [Antricoccus sp.]
MTLEITFTSFSDSSGKPLLVLGPSLGTSVEALWGLVIEQLAGEYAIVGFDLPGHGKSAATVDHFTIADIADEIAAHMSLQSDSFIYAGDSVGGAIGLQLMLDHRQQVSRTVLCCTGAQIGDSDAWLERAELVTRS